MGPARALGSALYLLVLVGAATWSVREPRAALVIGRCLVAALIGLFAVVLATGIVRAGGRGGDGVGWVHHGCGHLMPICAWSAIPIGAAAAIGRAIRIRRPLGAFARILAGLAVLGLSFLASITGYLGPTHGRREPMALNRFYVLHYGVFPGLLAIALAGWWLALRGRRPET
jgi:hypothetical protein